MKSMARTPAAVRQSVAKRSLYHVSRRRSRNGDHSRPEQQLAGTRVGVDVVLPGERQLAIGANPEDGEAGRNLSGRAAAVADDQRTLVADDQDPSRRVEGERARMIAARVD